MREHDWHGAARPLQGRHSRARRGQNNIWGKRDQLRREFAIEVCIASSPADIDPHIFAFGPAKFLQALPEGRNASLSYRIIRTRAQEHTEPPHAFGLLRARNEWNCGGTANKRDKFAPSHRRPDGQTPIWYRMMRWCWKSPCPLWVKSRHLQCKRSCPLHPQKRTCAVQLGMSA